MLDVDTVLIGAGTGIVSAILTFMVSRKDANTRANETVTSALTNTIESLEKHIAHLDSRMAELERQLETMSAENVKLLREVHELRKALATSNI
jgi:predicted RNase H-like nuclease (RuvC/YqgF family)